MAEVKITVRKDGPYLIVVDGSLTIVDQEGNAIPHREGRPVALCRCGGSTTKPFCDGTHSKIGFEGATAAVGASEAAEDE